MTKTLTRNSNKALRNSPGISKEPNVNKPLNTPQRSNNKVHSTLPMSSQGKPSKAVKLKEMNVKNPKKDEATPNSKSVSTNTTQALSNCMSVLECKWLSDEVIQNYFDLLTDKVINEDMKLMNPALTEAIKHLQEIDNVLIPLKLNEKSYVFFPVSDAQKIMKEGGSHWSLLLFARPMNRFLYFDSMGSYNLKYAKEIARNVSKYLGSEEIPCIQIVEVAKQENTVDCGVYLALYTDILVTLIQDGTLMAVIDGSTEFSKSIAEAHVLTKRAQLALLLHNAQYMLISSNTLKSMMYSGHSGIVDHGKHNNKEVDAKVVESCDEAEEDLHVIRNNCSNECGLPLDMNRYGDSDGRNKILLFADSHGRDLIFQVSGMLSTSACTRGHVQPGAPLEAIVEAAREEDKHKKLTKNDYIIVMGGCNNVWSHFRGENSKNIVKHICDLLDNMAKEFGHTNIIISTIPYRYDLREESFENEVIRAVNIKIRKLVYLNSHIQLLDLYMLERRYHTRHGLHMNRKGKQFVAKKIATLLVAYEDNSLRDPETNHDNGSQARLSPADELDSNQDMNRDNNEELLNATNWDCSADLSHASKESDKTGHSAVDVSAQLGTTHRLQGIVVPRSDDEPVTSRGSSPSYGWNTPSTAKIDALNTLVNKLESSPVNYKTLSPPLYSYPPKKLLVG